MIAIWISHFATFDRACKFELAICACCEVLVVVVVVVVGGGGGEKRWPRFWVLRDRKCPRWAFDPNLGVTAAAVIAQQESC